MIKLVGKKWFLSLLEFAAAIFPGLLSSDPLSPVWEGYLSSFRTRLLYQPDQSERNHWGTHWEIIGTISLAVCAQYFRLIEQFKEFVHVKALVQVISLDLCFTLSWLSFHSPQILRSQHEQCLCCQPIYLQGHRLRLPQNIEEGFACNELKENLKHGKQ